MKITLPDGSKVTLDKTLTEEKRKELVDVLLSEWHWYTSVYKNSKSKAFLMGLSNYLCYEKKVKVQVGEKDGEEKI